MAMSPGAHAIVGTGAGSTGSTVPVTVPVRMIGLVDAERTVHTEHSEHSGRSEHTGGDAKIGCTESVGVNRRRGKRAERTAGVGSSAYTGPTA
jgi:hypothetical protein